MAEYKISWNTAEKMYSPKYDMGVWHMIVDEKDVLERAESLVALGFTPDIEIVTEK